jgi:gas vesicle protein
MTENSSGNSLLTGLVVGAVVGAGLALLYAPCTGKDAREWLTRKSRKLKDQTEAAYEEAKATMRTEANALMGDLKDVARAKAAPSYSSAADKNARA